jgi:hypothetical protein
VVAPPMLRHALGQHGVGQGLDPPQLLIRRAPSEPIIPV